MRAPTAVLLSVILAATAGCSPGSVEPASDGVATSEDVQERLAQYTTVDLTADLSGLSDAQRRIVALLIEASDSVDEAYWLQTYGDRDELMAAIADESTQRLVEINRGPWDRLRADEPFIAGYGAKPAGARFYPADMNREEFEAVVASAAESEADALRGLYTMVGRDEGGNLTATPYHEVFAEPVAAIADRLRAAAELAEDPGFRTYLELRAGALETDDYQASDLAWMDMKDNVLDVVIGPIETYEDQLFGYKASFEAFVLLRDLDWSRRLSRYAALLPSLQRALPVDEDYKREEPGSDADLNAYDVLYVGGDANAGSKTIAINLPNDPEVQLQRGTRRLQLKNAMRAKFDRIMLPIAGALIVPEQRDHVTFDAFFANTMFHEVAHGLGIKNTLDGAGTVREALMEQTSWLEEGKADVLGLFMVRNLHERGELGDADLLDNYVTFVASIFRSIRFGTTSAHGRANLVRYSFFRDRGAFALDAETGLYRIDVEALSAAVDELAAKILTLQGDGDHDGVAAFWEEAGVVDELLQAALDRIGAAGIPVDIAYEQGVEVLGLGT